MGQLCCFPFSRDEDKISEKNGREPDDAELVSLSKRLVESAVLKAVQQYLDETQHKNRQTDGSPNETPSNDRNGMKRRRKQISKAGRRELSALRFKLNQIKQLLNNPDTRAKMYKEVCGTGTGSSHVERHGGS